MHRTKKWDEWNEGDDAAMNLGRWHWVRERLTSGIDIRSFVDLFGPVILPCGLYLKPPGTIDDIGGTYSSGCRSSRRTNLGLRQGHSLEGVVGRYIALSRR